MTPEEKAVLEAAGRWIDSERGARSLPGHSYPGDELHKAILALRESRNPRTIITVYAAKVVVDGRECDPIFSLPGESKEAFLARLRSMA